MYTRNLNWQLDFEKCVKENFYKPFKWGEHDCVLWAANCVLAITGFDPALEYRDEYSSPIGAARILKDNGGMEALVSEKFESVLPSFANIGDIVMILQNEQPMLAVCNGETSLAPGAEGLIALPTLSAVKAWRV